MVPGGGSKFVPRLSEVCWSSILIACVQLHLDTSVLSITIVVPASSPPSDGSTLVR